MIAEEGQPLRLDLSDLRHRLQALAEDLEQTAIHLVERVTEPLEIIHGRAL